MRANLDSECLRISEERQECPCSGEGIPSATRALVIVDAATRPSIVVDRPSLYFTEGNGWNINKYGVPEIPTSSPDCSACSSSDDGTSTDIVRILIIVAIAVGGFLALVALSACALTCIQARRVTKAGREKSSAEMEDVIMIKS